MPAALTRTYYTDVDYALSTASFATQVRNALWAMKASLKKEILATNSASVTAWTCVGSSDGVTGAMDGVDRWGATFDVTKIVRAASGVAHSWIVLYNAGLGLYFTIDYIGTQDYHCSFGFATTAPTGGSNATRATSTTEAATTSGTIFWDTTVATFTGAMFHRVFDSTGLFTFVVTRNAASRVVSFISLAVLTDLVYPSDPNPWVLITDYNSTTYPPLRSTASQWNSAGFCKARSPLGTTLNVGPVLYQMPTGSGDWLGGTSTHMSAPDFYTGKWLELPLWFGGQTFGKGRLADWCQSSESITQLALYPSAPPTHMFCGQVWFPFTAVPSV